MTSLQAIMLFDAHQLADFVQQCPCPTCQHTGYDATGSTMGLANIVLFKCVFKRQIIALGDTIHMDFLTNMTIDCFSAQYRKKERHAHLL